MLTDLVLDHLGGHKRPWQWAPWKDQAQSEGLLGLLAAQCDQPEARTFGREEFFRQALHLEELRRIDKDLAAAGLTAVVLKGQALLPFYANQLGVRPVGDIDLLVERGKLAAVRSALGLDQSSVRRLDCGYPIHLDLADNLVGAGRLRSRSRLYRFDESLFWSGSRPLAAEYQALRTLDPSHLYLYLATHALKHGYSRLIWLLDLALVLPHVEVETILKESPAAGSCRAVAMASELVFRLNGFDSPLRTRLVILNPWERACLAAIMKRRFPAELGELLCLFSLASWWDRLVFLSEYALLRPEIVRQQYPGPLWRAYAKRLGRIGATLYKVLSAGLRTRQGSAPGGSQKSS